MTDEQKARAQRLEYLREQLAALESYGNGDGQRAAAARAEIAASEAPRTGGDLANQGQALLHESGHEGIVPGRARRGNR